MKIFTNIDDATNRYKSRRTSTKSNFELIRRVMNVSDKYAQVMNQSFANTMPNVIKQAGASFAIGSVVTFAFDIASGNSIGQSASHAIVTSAATTAISYTFLEQQQ